MSLFYATSNNESARDLFEKRLIYRLRATQGTTEPYTNLVNFNFAEKFLYGRVNRYFIPMMYRPGDTVQLKSIRGQAASYQALNFVVDAFDGLALEFKRCVANGQLCATDPFLSNLIITNAYEDPTGLYNTYLDTYYNAIASEFSANSIRVTNFNEFVEELQVMLKPAAFRFPLTQPAFIKSRACPITCSGLALEIGSLDCSNDEEKINQFIDSPNWEFYLNACRSYGFMVDEFVPWRIVADIGSSPMLAYAEAYGASTTDGVLSLGYGSVHTTYFEEFKYVLLNLYNQVKPSSFVELQDCHGETTSTIVTPQSYTATQLSNIYDESYFLKLYLQIRFWEEESAFEAFEEEMLIDDTIELYLTHDASTALDIFERVLNKTFDYQGSLSYNKAYLEALALEED